MHRASRQCVAALTALFVFACATHTNTNTSTSTSTHGYDRADLDTSVAACDDFYQYAVGSWLAKNPIPAAYPSWGSANTLDEANREKMMVILRETAKQSAAHGTNVQLLGDLWTSCLDTAAIDKAGAEPLRDELARIEHLQSIGELQDELARLRMNGLPSLFSFGSDSDLKNPNVNQAQLGQGSLGLPEPNYYTDTDDRAKLIRDEYLKYVARIFTLLGDDAADAATRAQNVMRLERELASAELTRVQRRNIEAQYNIRTIAQLRDLAPSIDWPRYFAATGAAPFETMNVAHPKYFAELDRQLTKTPMEELRDYLRFRLADSLAPRLSRAFDDTNFAFRGTLLQGRKEQLPRERRCVAWLNSFLPDALGQIYAERHFTPATRARALEMIGNLQAALRDDIQSLPWMAEATRAQALHKLDTMALKIGYPTKWKDYSTIAIDRTSFAHNTLNATRFESMRAMERIGKPIDRTEWDMTVPEVNAYNNPVWNEIVFSAGILQPPFYDPAGDDAYNYGGMGAVIGHEIIHDFDDQGRKFAADGSLADWWTPEDATEFDARAKCVSDQFSSFDLGGGLRMDGKLVLGESIGDLGGLKIAYAAYEKSMAGKPRTNVDGFTPEQRFFLGWARIWANIDTREFMELRVKTDPHPISRFRVNGPLANMPEFATAFSCPAQKPMVRDARCVVW